LLRHPAICIVGEYVQRFYLWLIYGGSRMDIQNCRVLVTGASRGIGAAIARGLQAEGCLVAGTSRDPGGIPEQNRIPGVEYHQLELSDFRSIERLVRKLDNVDILINNAGVSQIGSVEDTSLEQLRYIVDVNIVGTIYLTKLLLPGMRDRRKGFIINITSLACWIAVPYSTAYAVSKHALDGFSKGLWHELKNFGIPVVSVAPVHINTDIPMIKTYPDSSPYAAETKRVKAERDKEMAEAPGPDVLARKVLKILKSRRPLPFYLVGKSSLMYSVMHGFIPQSTVQKMVRRAFHVDG
jgi:short-subunit dehydrogenase